MSEALASSDIPATFLLARGDNTAIAFRDAWRAPARIETCDTASHSFARAEDKQWLFERVREALAG